MRTIYFNKIKTIMLSFLIVFVISAVGWAAEYYVDGSRGNDSNPGTLSTPWKTISKANGTLRAGDTVFIRAGTYNQGIAPSNSGTSANRITYRNYSNEQVTISGVSNGINLNSRTYITVNGFRIRNVSNLYISLENSSQYNRIENVDCDQHRNSKSWDNGISLWNNARYNVLYRVSAGNVGNTSNASGGVVQCGANTQRDTTNYNLFDECTFYNGGHHVFSFQSGYNILRDCLIYSYPWQNGYGHRGIENVGLPGYNDYNVIDNCIIATTSNNLRTQADGVKGCFSRYIFRRNQIYDTAWSGIHLTTWASDDRANYNKIYNNTIYSCGYDASLAEGRWGLLLHTYQGFAPPIGNTVANNIVFNNNIGDIGFTNTSASNNDIRTNWTTSNGNPLFVNSQIDRVAEDTSLPNLNLQAGSPCINAGEFLTTIVSSSGSANTFTVTDASFFHDGYGVTYGDDIQLEGSTSTIRITDVNYSTNQITVDRNISWTKGQGVALPYSGTAPDLGANEFESAPSQSDLEPPFNLRILP